VTSYGVIFVDIRGRGEKIDELAFLLGRAGGFEMGKRVLLMMVGVLACAGARAVSADTLVGDTFASPYSGWVDAFPAPARQGTWRLSLHNPTLMDTNNANPPITGGGTNTGLYEPDVLIQDNFVAPHVYDLTAKMRSNDDDIIGLVWNYQDPSNYFRVGIRTQAAGSFGGTQGVAVQKVVGGVVTQISPAGAGVGVASPITQAMINNRDPFDLKVAVDGTNYQVSFNGTPIISGTDADLVGGRKVGVQSWAQLSDTDETPDPPFWGTEVDSISVSGGGGTLYQETFNARPVAWRQLVMTNAAGVSTASTPSKEDLGNFGLDLNRRWIHQQSNGFENATVNNTDFIGPAVVVDESGSAAFSDYEMKVRIGAADNDGVGVLVRVAGDNNFYRINFTNEGLGAGGVTRAPRGLSVQKVRNGVWSELFRDDQVNPLFVYTPATAGTNPSSGSFPMFDLSVKAIGDTLDISVIDHLGNVFDYPLIVDASDPLLSGTVGFATWGTDNTYYMDYGGVSGDLLTAIEVVPEPGVGVAGLAAMVVALRRRRR
jgi:hypothetical protein